MTVERSHSRMWRIPTIPWLAHPPAARRAGPGRSPAAAAAIDVPVGTSVYRIRVRRHRQARRYTLRIDAAAREAVLTMPPRGSLKAAAAFARSHGEWIAARLRGLPEASPFAAGAIVPFRGVPHRIVHRPGARGVVWVEEDGAQALLCVSGDAAHLQRRLTDFLKAQARAALSAASRHYAAQLGVRFQRVVVRDPSSRWGSCSTTGTLSFSWRLILAPAFVLDYLAAHEVAHLVEMNHGPRFWTLVRRLSDDMPRAKAWLERHGHDLHRFGALAAPKTPDSVVLARSAAAE